MKFIAYYRVSEKHGLGRDAQRISVLRHVAQEGGKLIREFSEPVADLADVGEIFEAAVQQCRRDKAALVLAESDPLSLQLHMLVRLAAQHVPFAAAGHPDVNKLLEPLFTDTRPIEGTNVTKLKVKKRAQQSAGRGNPDLPRARAQSVEVRKKSADEFASKYGHDVLRWRAKGDTLAVIAARLNDMNRLGPRGGKWHSTSVSNLIARCEYLADQHAKLRTE